MKLPLYYTIRDGEIVPCEAWDRLAHVDRRVGTTVLFNNVRISTVFLQLDHQFLEGGPPLIFETMVFGGSSDEEMQRYSTWDEAVAGHRRVVQKLAPIWNPVIEETINESIPKVASEPEDGSSLG